MLKLLSIILLAFVLVGGLGYFIFLRPQSNTEKSNPAGLIDSSESEASLSDESILTSSPIPTFSPTPTKSPTDLNKKIEDLEKMVANLQSRVGSLEKSSKVTTTQSSTSKSPIYIPLGSSGSSVSTDWKSVDTLTAIIDSSEYTGYSSMRIELSLKLKDANGTGYARLYNSDDGTAILSSEVSSSTASFTALTSSGFTLPAGKKTYKIQLKSLSGYEVTAQDVSIKVSF